jgi:rare lipoprotein A
VEVRVTDRGPFIDGRIIDLSRAAADRIDMVLAGIAKVRVEVIPSPPLPQASRPPPVESTRAEEPPAVAAEPRPQPSVRFAVQVAALRDATAAEALRRQMESRYGASRAVRRDGNPQFWRVLVGELDSEESAAQLSRKIREQNPEMASAFVVRLEDR